eukprot:TRINITY_DN3856_c0_g1_i1.p1 TRINITY_DN3856_c0_g1~~TRINITY_DN3856_c0_g1_i1.p1  ORF type:complete len:834 (+),score=194.02 TRINITY_DN3856_c0_g1_i1:50-2551(+)
MSNKEGYLFKKSKPQPFIGVTWQRRYFRMSDTQLLYFENAEKTKALGSILLKDIQTVRTADLDCGRPNSLMVEIPGRVFVFQADSSKECNDWILQINEKSRMTKEMVPSLTASFSSALDTFTQDLTDKEGYLNKAAKKGPKSGWKQRWCTLHKDLLYYYDNYMDKTGNADPIGTIPLSSILYLEASEEEETGRQLTFKLATTHRTYFFQAETKDDLMDWMKAFKTRMGDRVRLESFLEQDRRKIRLESVVASLVEKSGYLKKAGPEGGRTKVRFCVFKGDTLAYFEKEGNVKPIGVILLASCCDVRGVMDCAFELQTETRAYYFLADTPEERDDWVRVLTSRVNKQEGGISRYSSIAPKSIRKQGPIFKTGKNQSKWKRRHLVFQGDVVAYFDHADDLTRPLGVIHLRECSAIKETEPEFGRDFVWCLMSPTRAYKFCCETAGERESWIQAINEAYPQIEIVQKSYDRYGDYLTRANHADLEDFLSLNILRKTGVDTEGRSVVVFFPGRVPESADLNKALLLFIRVMDPIVSSPYVLVFVNSVSSKQVRISWLKSSYEILPRSYKKNMQSFYILHPTKWYTVLQNSMRPFVSQKVWSKTRFAERIADLYTYIKPDQISLPTEAFLYEQQQNPQKKVFGVHLDELLMRVSLGQGTEDVPPIVEKCCEFLEDNALRVEGIFRLAGNSSDVQEKKKLLDQGEELVFDSYTDPHLVSSLLKLWIRELPEPLMTFDLYDEWVEASDAGGIESYIQDLKTLFESLPPSNKMVLKKLLLFLHLVSQYSQVNKMTPANLSIVFAPNILRDRENNIQQSLLDSPLVNRVITTLIMHAPTIFQ